MTGPSPSPAPSGCPKHTIRVADFTYQVAGHEFVRAECSECDWFDLARWDSNPSKLIAALDSLRTRARRDAEINRQDGAA